MYYKFNSNYYNRFKFFIIIINQLIFYQSFHYLNNYFNKIDVTSAINPRNTRDYDIVIYDKGVELKLNTGQLKGAVTPDRANIPFLKACDFIIVGSVEEKESLLSYNKNCFIFPQIVSMYLNAAPKYHIQ